MNTREFVSYYKKLRKEQDETVEYEEAREEIEEILDVYKRQVRCYSIYFRR